MRDSYNTIEDFTKDKSDIISKWWARSFDDFGQIYPKSMYYFPEEIMMITSSSRSIRFNEDKFLKESEVTEYCKIKDSNTTECVRTYKAMRDGGAKNIDSPLVRTVSDCCDSICFCCNRDITLRTDEDIVFFDRKSIAYNMANKYNLFIAKTSDTSIEALCTSCIDKYQKHYNYSFHKVIQKFNNNGDYGELEVLMGLIQAKAINIGEIK